MCWAAMEIRGRLRASYHPLQVSTLVDPPQLQPSAGTVGFYEACVPIPVTYTRSQMMHVPSVLAVTHSSLFFFTLMQDTEDLCSLSASSSF